MFELAALVGALNADEYWRRDEAVRRLRMLEPADSELAGLAEALGDDESADRRSSARTALATMAAPGSARPRATLDVLARLLGAPGDPDVRLLAAAAMGESGNPEAREPLESALADRDRNVAASAAEALGMLEDPRAVPALAGALQAGAFWVRAAVVAALGRIGGPEALSALEEVSHDPALAVLVASALAATGEAGALEALHRPLQAAPAASDAVLAAAAAVLAAHPSAAPPEWLRAAAAGVEEDLAARMAEHDDPAACRLLGAAGTPWAAERLVEALCAPGGSPSAALGISLLPAELATGAILDCLDRHRPGATEHALLLRSLPELRERSAVDRVASYLAHPEEEVAAAASESLGRSAPAAVLPSLLEALRQPRARLWAARAYARLPGIGCEPLDPLLRDSDPRVRAAAAEGIARCGRRHAPRLIAALERERDPAARIALARAVGIAGGAEAAAALAGLIGAEDLALRFAAVEALGRTGAPEAYPPLVDVLADPHAELQAAALHALGELGDPRAARPLSERVGSGGRDLRRTAVFALDRLSPTQAVARLRDALRDSDREVRLTAARLLQRVGGAESIPDLDRLADTEADPLVRRAACDAAAALRARSPESRG